MQGKCCSEREDRRGIASPLPFAALSYCASCATRSGGSCHHRVSAPCLMRDMTCHLVYAVLPSAFFPAACDTTGQFAAQASRRCRRTSHLSTMRLIMPPALLLTHVPRELGMRPHLLAHSRCSRRTFPLLVRDIHVTYLAHSRHRLANPRLKSKTNLFLS